jgi:HSP90 family molecular chaperone
MSLSQGEVNFDLVPRLEATAEAQAPTDIDATVIAAVKSALGGQVTDVRASQRLTDSAACLVAGGLIASSSGCARAQAAVPAAVGRPGVPELHCSGVRTIPRLVEGETP